MTDLTPQERAAIDRMSRWLARCALVSGLLSLGLFIVAIWGGGWQAAATGGLLALIAVTALVVLSMVRSPRMARKLAEQRTGALGGESRD